MILKTRQTQNHHDRSNLLQDTFQTNIHDKASNDDEGIEAVKLRFKVPRWNYQPVYPLNDFLSDLRWSKCPNACQQFGHEQATERQAHYPKSFLSLADVLVDAFPLATGVFANV